MMHVLAGLDAVHERGIIHRDIKPENVFLAERKEPADSPSSCSISASRRWSPETPATTGTSKSALTKTGVVMGTPYYVSPEQARALRDVDARTDLYSCGVVLYEALTGELPFDANHFHALLLADPPGQPEVAARAARRHSRPSSRRSSRRRWRSIASSATAPRAKCPARSRPL